MRESRAACFLRGVDGADPSPVLVSGAQINGTLQQALVAGPAGAGAAGGVADRKQAQTLSEMSQAIAALVESNKVRVFRRSRGRARA